MDRENIMFYKNQDKSYTITDLYLSHNIPFGYEDSYNYYDIDVDKILLLKKSRNEYFVRYNNVDKKKIVPLQLKIDNFHLCELHMFTSGSTLVPIERDHEEFLMKCGEIWNKIAELMVIHNPDDFVEIDDYGDEFIMLEIEKNTTAVRDENKNDLAFVFTCVINNLLQTSLVQYRY